MLEAVPASKLFARNDGSFAFSVSFAGGVSSRVPAADHRSFRVNSSEPDILIFSADSAGKTMVISITMLWSTRTFPSRSDGRLTISTTPRALRLAPPPNPAAIALDAGDINAAVVASSRGGTRGRRSIRDDRSRRERASRPPSSTQCVEHRHRHRSGLEKFVLMVEGCFHSTAPLIGHVYEGIAIFLSAVDRNDAGRDHHRTRY